MTINTIVRLVKRVTHENCVYLFNLTKLHLVVIGEIIANDVTLVVGSRCANVSVKVHSLTNVVCFFSLKRRKNVYRFPH